MYFVNIYLYIYIYIYVCVWLLSYTMVRKLHDWYIVVQLLSHVWLLVTQWTIALQASVSFTISQSLFKLISTESMIPSNHLILYHPLLLLPSIFPNIRVIYKESALHIRRPEYWASVLASVLSMNIQGWCPLGFIDLILLLSKGLSRVFFNTSSLTQYSHLYLTTEKNRNFDYMDLYQQSDVSVF